jgi:hypothetical protein
MVGNTTIDLFNDTIQGTLLDINSDNVEANIFEIINSTSTPPFVPSVAHLRSNGYLTSAEALAGTLTATEIFTLDGITDPDYGDVFYEDEDGGLTFNGDYLFYKVVTVYPNTKVYQIRIDGVIIGIYT